MKKLNLQKRPVQEWFAIASLITIVISSILGMLLEDFLLNFISGIIISIIAIIWWAIVAWLAKSKNTPVVVLSWVMGLISLLYAVLQFLNILVVVIYYKIS